MKSLITQFNRSTLFLRPQTYVQNKSLVSYFYIFTTFTYLKSVILSISVFKYPTLSTPTLMGPNACKYVRSINGWKRLGCGCVVQVKQITRFVCVIAKCIMKSLQPGSRTVSATEAVMCTFQIASTPANFF